MKKIICLIIAVITAMSLLSVAPVCAAEKVSFFYSVSNGEATITGCSQNYGEALTIPKYYGGCAVTAIGEQAFYGCNRLKSITIPNTVKYIGEEAFYGCSSLVNVYYIGSANDWTEILIDNGNDSLNGIYFNSPAGWFESAGYKYYYSKKTGEKFAGGKFTVGSKKYNFDADGRLLNADGSLYKNGFVVENNKVKYYQDNEYLICWQYINGQKYYFAKATGIMKTGLTQIGSIKYNFDYNGSLKGYDMNEYSNSTHKAVNTNVEKGKIKYYVDDALYAGWKVLEGTDGCYKYYFKKSDGSAMTGGHKQIGALFYDFTPTGELIDVTYDDDRNAVTDIFSMTFLQYEKNGMFLDEDGKYRYYIDGEVQKTGWTEVNGNKYYFRTSDGSAMVGVKQKIGHYYYNFTKEGVYTGKTTADAMIDTSSNSLAVVTKVIEVLDADNNDVYEITFLQDGEEKALTTTSDAAVDVADFGVGTVFEFKSVNDTTIVKADKVIPGEITNTKSISAAASDNGQKRFAAGYVMAKTAERIDIKSYDNLFDDLARTDRHIVSKANFYVVDLTKSKISVQSTELAEIPTTYVRDNDVPEDDRDSFALIKYVDGGVVDVVVFKGAYNSLN